MFKKLKEKFLNRQFITFGVIGLVNTFIALLIDRLILLFGVEVGLASIIADVLAVIPSYIMNMTFTYHRRMSWKSFFVFPISYVPGWIVSFLLVEILHRGFGVPEQYAKLMSVPVYVPINYLVMTFVVNKFAGKKTSQMRE